MDKNNVVPDPNANVFNNQEYPGKPIITLLNVLQAPQAGMYYQKGKKGSKEIFIFCIANE